MSAEKERQELSKSDFREDVYATPALANSRIESRTSGHLSCFGSPDKK